MHYAVHGHTAAELIVERADAEKEHMGLTTWEKAPNGCVDSKELFERRRTGVNGTVGQCFSGFGRRPGKTPHSYDDGRLGETHRQILG